jgi:hypothetical protein
MMMVAESMGMAVIMIVVMGVIVIVAVVVAVTMAVVVAVIVVVGMRRFVGMCHGYGFICNRRAQGQRCR